MPLTKTTNYIQNEHIPDALIPLGKFAWPRGETRQTLNHVFEKLQTRLKKEEPADAVEAEFLKSISDDDLKCHAREILGAAMQHMLDADYLAWSRSTERPPRRRAFVHPPLDLPPLRDWARKHGLPVLDPGTSIEEFTDRPCVVIPELEQFFSRDHNQLKRLWTLFDAISSFDGHVLVGCNSWAWRFLRQFEETQLLFEAPQTLPAFGADALADVLTQAYARTVERKTATSAKSGAPILDRDEDGSLKDPYLEKLAGRSLGHPWVAIEMFFRGIAETKDVKDAPERDVTWVNLPKGTTLPTSTAQSLLFGLHTLMVHGPRAPDDLNALLPHRAPHGLWEELARTGFVKLEHGRVTCVLRNYPDIRSELSAAGFNLDEL